tara:strand:+ start:19373 stop:21304 length:1932 start_codon:yes stop_codon:yes gene_type:complete
MIIASIYPCPYDIQDRHDHNAAIIYNDKIFAYEEEKLTGIKNEGTVRFPERSLMMGMKELNITPSMVNKWVFPKPRELNMKGMELFFSTIVKAYKGNPKKFKEWFNKKVEFVPHQISHVALGYYGSSFQDTAFLSLDGGGDYGDDRNYVFGEFVKNKIFMKYENKSNYNIGSFHAYITDALGFNNNESGKTSGLASYGNIKEELVNKFNNLLNVSKNGIFFNRRRFGSTKINLNKIKPREYNRAKFMNQYPSSTNVSKLCLGYLPQDIAATGEYVFKEKILDLLKILKKTTKINNLILSGGVFQNVSVNRAVIDSKLFKNYYFTMASGDSGLALGAALYISSNKKKLVKRKYLNPFLGPSFDELQIKDMLESYNISYEYNNKNIEKTAAKLISEGFCLGWFQGRAEYGPRSLGARSILADPRKNNSKARINQLLKKRDWFMPYAPSIMYEYSDYLFKKKIHSPYMQVALTIDKNNKNIPSAIHKDETSRVHTIEKNINSKYWKLIDEFRKITGVPVILNTSFNRHGISTISEPKQALEHLLEGCMDYLIIENFIVAFDKNRKTNRRVKKEEKEINCLKRDVILRLKVFENYKFRKYLQNYISNLNQFLKIKININIKNLQINFQNKNIDIDKLIKILLKKYNL